ncbi:unnamed protein product, partial [Mesorhabditis belari]|uniref:Uncharacterized protein n=1 Tax=Mesorhabditis belari TaxID=2138241 RepID=A0AAF3JAK6_9BILA
MIMLKPFFLAFFLAYIGIVLGESEAVISTSTSPSIPNDPKAIEACLQGNMGQNEMIDECWQDANDCDDLVRNMHCIIAAKTRICGGDLAKNYTKWIYVEIFQQMLRTQTHRCTDRLIAELEMQKPKPCERCLDFENIFYTEIGENALSKHFSKYWIHENGCKVGELSWKNPDKSKIRLRLGDAEDQLKDIFLKCDTKVSIFCDNNGKWLLEGDDGISLKNYSLTRIQAHPLSKSTGDCDRKLCELCLPFDKLATNRTNISKFWHKIVTENVQTKNGYCMAAHITWESKNQSKIRVKMIDVKGTTYELYLKCEERVTLFCNNDRRWRWENPKKELVYLKGIESEMLSESERTCEEEHDALQRH